MKYWIFIVALFFSAPLNAQDQLLAVDLAEDHVDITTGFNGAHLTLFGVQEEAGDIAIVITGPEEEMVVRRKEKIAGIWMNRKSMTFENVPVFYSYALEKPEKDMAPPERLMENRIGMASLRFMPEERKTKPEELKTFQDALIRNRQAQRAFPQKPEKITFISDKFFRTTFYIPPNVATGRYEVKTYLLKNGRVQDISTTDVKVAQVGASAAINDFSHTWSLAYGMLCVLMAVTIGWFSNSIRRGVR
jgi:uncharacterized protein (TIGR02186 family)